MQSSVYRDKASSIAMILETQRNVEFPHRIVDKRPRKRPRLTWDAAAPLLPPPPPPPPTVTICLHIFVLCNKGMFFSSFHSSQIGFYSLSVFLILDYTANCVNYYKFKIFIFVLKLSVSWCFFFQVFQPPLYYGPEFASGVVPNFVYPNMFYNGLPRQGSPPWRPDDKDGHYVFVVGDTLTPRCESKCYRVFRHLICFVSQTLSWRFTLTCLFYCACRSNSQQNG